MVDRPLRAQLRDVGDVATPLLAPPRSERKSSFVTGHARITLETWPIGPLHRHREKIAGAGAPLPGLAIWVARRAT